MLRFIFIAPLLVIALTSFAQRTVKVTATYTYYVPETMSLDEAKRVALDRAKIQAIADEFGTIVTQSSSTLIETKNGESDTQFFSRGGSNIKGEWIETLSAPDYHISSVDGSIILEVTVKGKIRELPPSRVEFVAIPLRNGTEAKFSSTNFNEGDDFYLLFKSPINGYMAAFWLDNSNDVAYQIIPYRNKHEAFEPIIANNERIFFSKFFATKEEIDITDEFEIISTSNKEYNELYILFSPNSIEIFKDHNYDEINEIPLSDFIATTTELLQKNTTITNRQIPITITSTK